MEILSYTFSKMASILKSKKAFIILLALLFAALPSAMAQTSTHDNNENTNADKNYQRIIPLSSPIYREMDRLYLLAGKSRPSLSRPWSADEAKKIMEALPQSLFDSVPDSSLAVIKREIEFGNKKTGARKAALKVSPEINVEGYIKANDERKEWEHGYEKRQPLVFVPLEGWFLKSIYMDLEIALKQEHAVANLTDNYTNIIPDPFEFDWHFPFRSFLSVGGEHWNFQFGRDTVSWGAGVTSNMVISDYSDYFNLIRFTTYWDRVKFTVVYIGLDPWLTDKEEEIDANNGFGGYDSFGELFKAFLAHRIEFKIRDNLSMAISEAIIFGNKYINITELNPVFIFHSHFTPQYSNVILALEADYPPFSGFNIYLQFAMDEFQAPGEDEGSRPRAMGFLGGFTFTKQVFDGFLLFNLEAAFTDPFLYNRWHPNTRFTNRRRMWSYVSNAHEYINKPIGYEYGPDAIIIYGAAQFEKSDKYLFGIDAKYRLLGSMNDSLDMPESYSTGADANKLRTPSGTVEKNLVLGLYGKLQLTNKISLGSNIYYIHISNYENISGSTINDFELALSAGFKF